MPPTLRLALTLLLAAVPLAAQTPTRAQMDHDLLEISIPQLESLYAAHRYTAVQVTQWYLDRIARFDPRYKAVIHVAAESALKTAAAEDAAARSGAQRGPLWGVPMLLKSNYSIEGMVTNDGWKGFLIPGHELTAPRDATAAAKLRAAGAILLGQTNMPDFAASDTNKSTAGGRTGNAYDARFSPGGSSGGTVTAITANFALVGTGTDTSNSIRMPSGTSAVVGVMPTRGLVSIAGIAPLDWLLDNTGPIARDVTSAAITLSVMAGEDPLDFRTKGSAALAQPGPYTRYLNPGALKGKRFGVPAFIIAEPPADTPANRPARNFSLRPETRALFLQALDALRAAGATVVIDPAILPADTFPQLIGAINTRSYRREGTETFLKDFGPADYHSAEAYEKATGQPLPPTMIGGAPRNPPPPSPNGRPPQPPEVQRTIASDPAAYHQSVEIPRAAALAAYNATLDKFHLDGFVYPALQMPPNDETIPQPDGRPSSGPHSNTGWVNRIGTPSVVVPAGFYATGLPFGFEFNTRIWHDGDVLGWAFAFEQATHFREPPVLVSEPRAPEPE